MHLGAAILILTGSSAGHCTRDSEVSSTENAKAIFEDCVRPLDLCCVTLHSELGDLVGESIFFDHVSVSALRRSQTQQACHEHDVLCYCCS